jgi:hypothetical protein
MRPSLLASLLLIVAAACVSAQSVIHEYRPEIAVTSPRVDGFGLTFLIEHHLETESLFPNERIMGFGMVSPTFHHVSAAFEARQVQLNGILEHRYLPILYSTLPLPAGFELRDRARIEMRDIDRVWSRRYQNRATVGHFVDVGGRELFPYVQLELSYDSRFSELNRRDSAIGVRIPMGAGVSVDPYIDRQSDTRRAPFLLVAGGAIVRIAL